MYSNFDDWSSILAWWDFLKIGLWTELNTNFLGYCNSMINPIIYSFTVKEFKRSAKRALLPFWSCLHNHCPRWISKPPDLRITTRMARRQQIRTAPSIEQDMRFRVPGIFAKTNARSATATLMRGVNALLPQSSSIVDKSERRVKITESSSSNKNELKLRYQKLTIKFSRCI